MVAVTSGTWIFVSQWSLTFEVRKRVFNQAPGTVTSQVAMEPDL